MALKNKFHLILFFSAILFCGFFCSGDVSGATLGEQTSFYIDPNYDISNRKEISAVLEKISDKLYFYIDSSWWDNFSSNQKDEIRADLSALADEFGKNIYPVMTSNYGFEWKPGIDNDNHITVLIHPMRSGAGGYFNSGNEYDKLQIPTSNQREMIYFNSDYISGDLAKGFLAHEFTHLITFNQKEKIHNIEEEIWLNEARAEYAPTLCGYDNNYETSNLRRRVIEFLKNPSDSLTNWKGASSDYGALNLFMQYLVDYYGVEILNDSLHSDKKGIESINYALEKNGYSERFSDVFTDWTITVLVNNCSLGDKYCYKNGNLGNIRVFPDDYFLSEELKTDLSANYVTKNWASYWSKISGGKGNLSFEFSGSDGDFKVPYLLCEDSGKCSIQFLFLDENNHGKLELKDFNPDNSFFTVIPSVQNDKDGRDYYFSWVIRSNGENGDNGSDEEAIKKLLEQIELLKAQILAIEKQISQIEGDSGNYCTKIENDLYYGLENNQEVSCLQKFLKNQGETIYPEGLITGNFFTLTKNAVIKFQEKYYDEVLKVLGLSKGTGYVGEKTREKINKMLP